MKHALIGSLLCTSILLGCTSGYHGTRTPLQKGEVVTFSTLERAAKFRLDTLNDFTGTSTNVVITRPTVLFNE